MLHNIDAPSNACLIDLEEHPKVVKLDHFRRLPSIRRSEQPRRMVCFTSQLIT
jgi:hypothetical protein